MAIAKPKPKKTVTKKQADKLADKLENKTFGEDVIYTGSDDEFTGTTISLKKGMLKDLRLMAFQNKSVETDPVSVSAIVQIAIQDYLDKQ